MHSKDTTYASSERSTIRVHPERGSASRDQVRAILEEARICTVTFVEDGRPVAIPMTYGVAWDGPHGDELLLHGSLRSRLMKSLADGREVCVTVTLLDGLVLARSAFHTSMNYRSVVLFGRGRPITEATVKREALEALVEHLLPGRGSEVRPTSQAEVDGTAVVALVIDEATAKVRTGPPVEPERDVSFPVWAGVVPVDSVFGDPVPAPDMDREMPSPSLEPRGAK